MKEAWEALQHFEMVGQTERLDAFASGLATLLGVTRPAKSRGLPWLARGTPPSPPPPPPKRSTEEKTTGRRVSTATRPAGGGAASTKPRDGAGGCSSRGRSGTAHGGAASALIDERNEVTAALYRRMLEEGRFVQAT